MPGVGDLGLPGRAARLLVGEKPRFDSSGWLTPPFDDGLRRPDGLYRAGWLLNQYSTWATTDDKRIALNVALWEAIYGDYFQYQSGLTSSQETHLSYLLGAYGGQTTTRVRWYDNDAIGPYHQDFIEIVPEPTTLLLLGGGFLGAAAFDADAGFDGKFAGARGGAVRPNVVVLAVRESLPAAGVRRGRRVTPRSLAREVISCHSARSGIHRADPTSFSPS